jgi:hypothetical protein
MRRRGTSGGQLTLLLGLALSVWLLVVALPRLAEPATLSLAQAMRDLGPISGWRCAQSASYVYDPRRDLPDQTLLAEAPELLLVDQVADLEVERVEANLRGGDTVIWTRSSAREEEDPRQRVYVLSPGRLQTIGVALDSGWTAICTSHLGDWHIVAEHALE